MSRFPVVRPLYASHAGRRSSRSGRRSPLPLPEQPDQHAATALLEPLLPDVPTGGRDGIMGFDDCQRIGARMCKLCAYATTHMMRDVSIATAEADNEQWCVHRFMGKVCTHCARAGR